jgi:GntR family transcriptional repressor for pyruvate dehydrogenase complex
MAAQYESVERHSTTDTVVDAIQLMIVQRELNPGDALPSERDLAQQLAVSRNVLRESLGILGQRGLISSRQGAGTFVSVPSGEQAREAMQLLLEMRRVDLVELCDARLLIEPELAARAAERASTSQLGQLRTAYAALAVAREDPETHVQADIAFHSIIAELSGHTVLKALVDAVREPVTRGMIVGTARPLAIDDSDEQHEAILTAILAGDATGARAAMTTHLHYVRETLTSQTVHEASWGGR